MSPQRSKVDLEDVWRMRVEQAAKRYKLAKANSANVLEEFTSGLTVPPDGSAAIRRASMEENAALDEHIRVLRIFNDLTVRGKIPDDE